MRTLIDTCSLVELARYYHPFDSIEVLNKFLESQIRNGCLIVLDKVLEETKYVSQGLAYKTFTCLQNKSVITPTSNLFPTTKFYHMLDENFVDKSRRRRLENESEYQKERDNYLKGTDCSLAVYAMNENHNSWDPIRVLTQETRYSNDRKLYKKIPDICFQIGVEKILQNI